MTKSVRSAGSPNVVFAFTGQGAQWTGMGAELLAYPHFRQSVEAAQSYLHTIGCKWSLLGESLFELLFHIGCEEVLGRVRKTEHHQTSLFAQ